MHKLNEYSKDSWIEVIDPNEKEIDFLIEKFNLNKDWINDGLDINEIPRLEEEEGNIYVYLRIPTFNIENEYTGSFLFVLTKGCFMTISDSRLQIYERMLRTKKDFTTSHRPRSLLEVLMILSNKYSYWIRYISKEVKKNRRNLKNLSEKDILELVLQEDILNDYLSSLEYLINLHSWILKCKCIKFNEKEKMLVEDLIVDLNQTLNICESVLKSISNMRDYYTTTLSNGRNEILRVLTIFTVFLTVPMVLSGLYGMNVKLPYGDHPYAFFMLLASIFFIWTVSIIILKKTKIL
ncbi:MAG: magnesium transporter CorA family protein [Nanoarchaeota archaeon]|nr:magnesium transporter CorA family protein [Nanoarchaeota archaeon]